MIPLGYSNGHTTYIPTAEQVAQGGYEGYSVFINQGKPSPLAPSIEESLKRAMVELVDNEGDRT